jgi:hypothetical protein
MLVRLRCFMYSNTTSAVRAAVRDGAGPLPLALALAEAAEADDDEEEPAAGTLPDIRSTAGTTSRPVHTAGQKGRERGSKEYVSAMAREVLCVINQRRFHCICPSRSTCAQPNDKAIIKGAP